MASPVSTLLLAVALVLSAIAAIVADELELRLLSSGIALAILALLAREVTTDQAATEFEFAGMGVSAPEIQRIGDERLLTTERGSVKEWRDEEGWGVLSSPDVPGDVWVHFSAVEDEGYHSLEVGSEVTFEYTPSAWPGGQDGYYWIAERVAPAEK